MHKNGTQHHYSCPYRPQNNAVVERNHQHFFNVASSLFFQSKIFFSFWDDCISIATHNVNRTPSPIIKHHSPYELLYDTCPNYDKLKVFGCLAYAATIPHPRSKFLPRANPCVFIGCPNGVKGYKLYNIDTKTIIISRYVVFNETIFPFHTSPHNLTYTYNFPFSAIPNPIPQFEP